MNLFFSRTYASIRYTPVTTSKIIAVLRHISVPLMRKNTPANPTIVVNNAIPNII